MSREIKFRIWDKENKDMIDLDFEGIRCNFEHQVYSLTFGYYIGGCEDCNYPDEPKNFELMQFTGLKDTEENEIFEGDIINFNSYENEDLTGVVEFSYGCFVIKDVDSKWQHEFDGSADVVVLGNRCQHPELLKEEK